MYTMARKLIEWPMHTCESAREQESDILLSRKEKGALQRKGNRKPKHTYYGGGQDQITENENSWLIRIPINIYASLINRFIVIKKLNNIVSI